MIDFRNPSYLKAGNKKQQNLYELLNSSGILTILKEFDPVITGTYPININITGSDVDIACFFKDRTTFTRTLEEHFSTIEGFILSEKSINGFESIIARFELGKMPFEIFGQNRPIEEQESYRHMISEYLLLQKYGEDFRQKIIALKIQGLKTEPAFATLLKLDGNPFKVLLDYSSINSA